jgi:iron(III) transport system ATP-binding protein
MLSRHAGPYLEVQNITKRFGSFTALEDVSFSAEPGEFVTILGPSGCGKTTVLRVVAGLEPQTSGRVLMQGRDVSSLPVSKRNIGIVFQSYALFPNLTAAANVAYGLTRSMGDRTRIRRRADELLELVGLAGMGEKYPAQLSGGQQQRVALARAMALSPDLLLLDEPLSALDAKVRVLLRSEIRQLQKRLGVTTIMVTHDQEEALTMADRILVMHEGRVAQYGTPMEIYDRPASPFVASFIGSMNFIDGAHSAGERRLQVGEVHLELTNGDLEAAADDDRTPLTVAIRPEDILIGADRREGMNALRARVRFMEYRGAVYRLGLELQLTSDKSARLEAELPTEKVRRLRVREQGILEVFLPAERIRVYAASRVHAAGREPVL